MQLHLLVSKIRITGTHTVIAVRPASWNGHIWLGGCSCSERNIRFVPNALLHSVGAKWCAQLSVRNLTPEFISTHWLQAGELSGFCFSFLAFVCLFVCFYSLSYVRFGSKQLTGCYDRATVPACVCSITARSQFCCCCCWFFCFVFCLCVCVSWGGSVVRLKKLL